MGIVDGRSHFGRSLAEIAGSGHIAQRARRAGVTVPAMATRAIAEAAPEEDPKAMLEAAEPIDVARGEAPILADIGPMSEISPEEAPAAPDPQPVYARIYRNQWIADCPDCGNAEYVWIEEPLFMCSECFNGAIGGAWRPVIIPNDRADIEAALGARPLPKTRNWQQGETLDSIRAENVAHEIVEVA